ncbi:hypothetical protein CAEBREN_19649 [Caenorhabditis brenneri]|uniref:DUF7809 domain-containing protein n=1 Tax=Caenorhabditis brenneri TaxID=135651 RepID=G0MWY4_CAEBE|nr:hypothetical protein CAEBREN_19649 [Caenorhabditis brenneri]
MLESQFKNIDRLAALPAALRSYIPKQLLKNVELENCYTQNELEYVQKVLDSSNDSLRMYGSAESLLQDLKVYMEFPLSRKMFLREMGTNCYTIPNIYHTLKKEVLYCKQDLLFHLQSCVHFELKLFEGAQMLKFSELIEYMKKHEERLSGCYEFVKYGYDVFEDIEISLSCYESLHLASKNAKVAAKDRNATVVVRIFDDGNSKFVMESELFTAINLKNPDQKPLECMDVEGHYRTIEYKHVIEHYRDRIGDIDFIYHLIEFDLHAAVPIVTPTGDHCILAVDAHMDIIAETISVDFFQKITKNKCHMIPKFIAIKYRYFINLKLFQKLREELEEFWKPIEDKPVKRVRNVGPQGFTLEDLKRELKYLGYTNIFPEITAEARSAYANFHSQKPSELKTSDMFAAIQGALALVLTKRYPCLNEFVYRQKVCLHNRSKPCDYCLEAIKETEARIEAEMNAESEQASSSITATTSRDDVKTEKNSKKFNPESVTSEALPIKTLKEKDAELERLKVFEEKSKKSDETEKKMKDLEKEAEEWKMKHFKVLEENVKMGNMLKNTGKSKVLESQVKEKDEQLKLAQKALEEKEQNCKDLEKAVKEKLLEAEKNIETLESQLMKKTKDLEESKKEKNEVYKMLDSSILNFERRLNELELKNSKHTAEQNQEIEKLKKLQAMVTKENKKEMEQLKRNACTSADEIKKLTARIAEKEGAENLLKRSNKGVLRNGSKSIVHVLIAVESNSIRLSSLVFDKYC